MRKFLGNSPALEAELKAEAEARAAAEAEAAERAALESISLEEEQLLVDEANSCGEQAKSDLAEADRIADVSDALEDLAVIAGGIEAPTQAEQDLIANSAQMAVAGTEIAPEEVVPAMEAFTDWKAKAGDFAGAVKARAKEIWERIMGFLKKIWAQIQEFFFRIFDTIPRLQKKISEQLKEVSGKSVHDLSAVAPIKMNVGAVSLSVNGTPVADTDALLAGFTGLTEVTGWLTSTYAKAMKARGEALAKQIEEFSWDSPMACADGIVSSTLGSHPLPAIPGAHSGSKAVTSGFTISTGKNLLGGISLRQKAVDREALPAGNPLAAMDLIRKESISIERHDGSELGRAWQLVAPDPHRAASLLKDAQEILKNLESWKKTGFKELEGARAKLESASSKAATASKTNKDAIPKDLDVALYRGALNFNTAFAQWSTAPAVDLVRSALASVRALTVLVDKSIAAWGDQTAALPAPAAAKA